MVKIVRDCWIGFQFGLSPLQTGGMFLIFGGVYAGTASIWYETHFIIISFHWFGIIAFVIHSLTDLILISQGDDLW